MFGMGLGDRKYDQLSIKQLRPYGEFPYTIVVVRVCMCGHQMIKNAFGGD